jgi:ketosteroid isomerase-like protein
MPPGTDFLEGKAAIRAFLEEESALENLSIGWSTRSGYVAESGDLAYLVEELRMEFDAENGDRVSVPGKIVTVWRKNSAGEWKNVADIYNYNRQ